MSLRNETFESTRIKRKELKGTVGEKVLKANEAHERDMRSGSKSSGDGHTRPKTQSTYDVVLPPSKIRWNEPEKGNSSEADHSKSSGFTTTRRRLLPRTYKREVICPKCDLKVYSFSSDVVTCRRCGLSYTFPYCDRPFDPKSVSDKTSSKRRPLKLECRECHTKKVVNVYPGEVIRCSCRGLMVWKREQSNKK